MNHVLYPLCAMLAALTALYKLRELRRREEDPALGAMCVACTLLTATFTLSTPVIGMSIDRLSGVPNLGTLVAQGCVLLYAASLQTLLLLWSYPSAIAYNNIQRRLLAFGTVLAVLVILLLTAPPTEERPTDFVVTYAGEPHYAVYFLLYTAAFATSMTEVIRLCLRYAKVCDRPWLRRSLRVTTAGSRVDPPLMGPARDRVELLERRTQRCAAAPYSWAPREWSTASKSPSGPTATPLTSTSGSEWMHEAALRWAGRI